MAKQPSSRGGTTKVRFLMLEAEGAESDLTQIFAAIQNAVKPSTTLIQQRIPATPNHQVLIVNDAPDDVIEEAASDDLDAVEEKPRRPKTKSVRKPTTPEVLYLDFKSDVSLNSFAERCSGIDSDVDRYLVIAAWFKEHRGVSAITTAHIYTGYRVLDWPTDIEDFGGNLRYLKKQQLMASVGKGEYAINHLGLARAKKLVNGS